MDLSKHKHTTPSGKTGVSLTPNPPFRHNIPPKKTHNLKPPVETQRCSKRRNATQHKQTSNELPLTAGFQVFSIFTPYWYLGKWNPIRQKHMFQNGLKLQLPTRDDKLPSYISGLCHTWYPKTTSF